MGNSFVDFKKRFEFLLGAKIEFQREYNTLCEEKFDSFASSSKWKKVT